MEQYKTCTGCNQSLPNTLFSPSKLGKLGTRSKCRPCSAKQTKNYRIKNPNYASEYSKLYREKFPEKVKQANERFRKQNPDYGKSYHNQHRNAERLRSRLRYWQNPQREALRKKKFREENPEVLAERNRRYRRNNPEALRNKSQRRRARLRQNAAFAISKKELQKLYASKCFYCGDNSTTVDHVVPIVRGGSHSIGNLVPACNHCNFSKAGRTIMEWRLWKMRLGL